MIDPRLSSNQHMDEAHHRVSAAVFKYLLTEMVRSATGGLQQYTGRLMRESHQHLQMTAPEWDAFWDDLPYTLDTYAAPQGEQAELKAMLASARAAIIV
jgi:hemoglobin